MEKRQLSLQDAEAVELCPSGKRSKNCQNNAAQQGWQSGVTTKHSNDDYDVAWICALHIEMGAARAMLDETHSALPQESGDSNSYALGRIQSHNVVIACLPNAEYGNNNAVHVASNLNRTFPCIKAWLMVGIGGAAPSRNDIRLGDVVVGTRIMQYDLGKIMKGGEIKTTATPKVPKHSLGTVVSNLRSIHEFKPNQINSILEHKLGKHPHYLHPNLPDRLFQKTYEHGRDSSSCEGCDASKLMPRRNRTSDSPEIHYGAIASSNQVMKDAWTRDKVGSELDVICFEMETAGLMSVVPCLPIRGICDYADSHKSKEWQRYASATASAYARELLGILPGAHGCVPDSSKPANELHENHRKLLLKSLKFDQIESRRLTIKKAYKKTCSWFLNHPLYKAWLDPAQLKNHHGFLWISGKPGAGKSTILKFAHSAMKKEDNSKYGVIASFFFNARGVSLERSVSGMYRSLLIQLLEGYPNLEEVLDKVDDPNHCPPLGVLKDIFRAAILKLGKQAFTCFIDALDECDEQQAVEMVYFIETLTEDSTAMNVPLRICFSSRHYPYIKIKWSVRLTLEDEPGHTEDLINYTKSNLRISNPLLIKELQPKIIAKAAGVFLWVALVINILNDEDRRGRPTLLKRLEELPNGLSNLFLEILTRDKENMEDLLLSTLWVLFATTPLQPDEYFHALWSGLYLKGLADSDMPDMSLYTQEAVIRYVTSSSKGLVGITKSGIPTVQFIHESVRDFLLKHNGLNMLWADLGSEKESCGHQILKDCCQAYLNHPTVRESISWGESNDDDDSWSYPPFLEYAGQNLLYHADVAAKAIPQDSFLAGLDLPHLINVFNITNDYGVNRYTESASLLYILAEASCPELIRTWLKDHSTIEILGERHRYPLFAALSSARSKRTAAALLGLSTCTYKGVDIFAGLDRTWTKQYDGHTPLTWAARNGRVGFTELLLKKGVDIRIKNAIGRTALAEASFFGAEAIVQILLENGAAIDIDTRDHYGSTPLVSALENKHEPIASLLVEKGAALNIPDSLGLTPLMLALKNRLDCVATMLLEKGANIGN